MTSVHASQTRGQASADTTVLHVARGRGPTRTQTTRARSGHDHVEQLVGEPVGALEVEQRPQEHEVDEPGDGDPRDGGEADDAPPPPVAGRVPPQLPAGDRHEEVALDREVRDEAAEPDAEARDLRLVEDPTALEHEDGLEDEGGRGDHGDDEVEEAGAGCRHARQPRAGRRRP